MAVVASTASLDLQAIPAQTVAKNQVLMSLCYNTAVNCMNATKVVNDVVRLINLNKKETAQICTDVAEIGKNLIKVRLYMNDFVTAASNFIDVILHFESNYAEMVASGMECGIATSMRELMRYDALVQSLTNLKQLHIDSINDAVEHLNQWYMLASGEDSLRSKWTEYQELADKLRALQTKELEASQRYLAATTKLATLQGALSAVVSQLAATKEHGAAARQAKQQLDAEAARLRDYMARCPPQHTTTTFLFWTITSNSNNSFDQARQAAEAAERSRMNAEAQVRGNQAAELSLFGRRGQLEGEINATRDEQAALQKSREAAEKAVTDHTNLMKTKENAMKEDVEKVGGGPIGHCITALTAVYNMYSLKQGDGDLQRFADAGLNMLKNMETCFKSLDKADSFAKIQQLMNWLRRQTDAQCLLGPLVVLEERVRGITLSAASSPARLLTAAVAQLPLASS